MTTLEQQLHHLAHAAGLLAARHQAGMLLHRAETAYHQLGNSLGRAACRAQALVAEQQHRSAYHRRHPAFVLAQLSTLTTQLAQLEQRFIGLQGGLGSPAYPAAWPLQDLLASLATQLN